MFKVGDRVRLVFNLQADNPGEDGIPRVGDEGYIARRGENGECVCVFYGVSDDDEWTVEEEDIELIEDDEPADTLDSLRAEIAALKASNAELRASADEAQAARVQAVAEAAALSITIVQTLVEAGAPVEMFNGFEKKASNAGAALLERLATAEQELGDEFAARVLADARVAWLERLTVTAKADAKIKEAALKARVDALEARLEQFERILSAKPIQQELKHISEIVTRYSVCPYCNHKSDDFQAHDDSCFALDVIEYLEGEEETQHKDANAQADFAEFVFAGLIAEANRLQQEVDDDGRRFVGASHLPVKAIVLAAADALKGEA